MLGWGYLADLPRFLISNNSWRLVHCSYLHLIHVPNSAWIDTFDRDHPFQIVEELFDIVPVKSGRTNKAGCFWLSNQQLPLRFMKLREQSLPAVLFMYQLSGIFRLLAQA